MTKLNAAQRIEAIAEVKGALAEHIAARKVRDAKFAEGARKRSEKYLAFFATDRFAATAFDYGFDLTDLFSRCDKTLDRFVRVLDTLNRDTLQVASDRDQNRYTLNLMRTLVASVNAQATVAKSDVFATATKVDNARDFVNVSRRVMSESTADRQSGIAVYVLELLGFLHRSKNLDGSVSYHVNRNSKIYRKVLKLIAANA